MADYTAIENEYLEGILNCTVSDGWRAVLADAGGDADRAIRECVAWCRVEHRADLMAPIEAAGYDAEAVVESVLRKSFSEYLEESA